jgi:hypothetical protein
VQRMSRQEHAAWGRRLLHDAGFLKPWPVGAKRLPDTIADDVPERLVYESFLLLLGLTWQVFPENQSSLAETLRFPGAESANVSSEWPGRGCKKRSTSVWRVG